MLLEKMVIINLFIAKMILPYAIMGMFSFSQNVCTMAYVATFMLASPFELNEKCNIKRRCSSSLTSKISLH
jgi:hypothetical protein